MIANERRRHRRTEHFMFKNKGKGFIPVWMHSDQEDTLLSLMVDISARGCSLLVSKQIPELQGELNLNVYSTDKGLQERLTLRAEQRWCDDTYSIEHKRIGLEFTHLTVGTQAQIDRLVQAFAEDAKPYFLVKMSSAPSAA